MIESPLLLVFPVAMAFAAALDLLTLRIPNKISLALVGSFLVVAPLIGLSWPEIGIHVATGAAVLVLGFCLNMAGVVGGGDAKLLAASALWLGFESLPEFLLSAGVLGGAMCLVILGMRQIPVHFMRGPGWLLRLHDKASGVPYGLAIGGAALLMYPKTPWFAALFA